MKRTKRLSLPPAETTPGVKHLVFTFHPEDDVLLLAFLLPAPCEHRVCPTLLRVRDEPEGFRPTPRGTKVKKRVLRRFDLVSPADVRAGQPVEVTVDVSADFKPPLVFSPQLLVVFDDAKKPLV